MHSENIYTTPEVIQEIRDQQSREYLETLNYFTKIVVKAPSAESLTRVQKACITLGELGSVSKQDVGVIALTLDILEQHSDFKFQEVESKLDERLSQVFYDSNAPSQNMLKQQQEEKEKLEKQKEEEAEEYIREFKERQRKKLLKQGMSAEEIDRELNENQTNEQEKPENETEEQDDSWNNGEWVTQETLQQQKEDQCETQQLESEVALFTADFAMQNIALQLRIPLAAQGSRRITKLARYALKCPACLAVFINMDRVTKYIRNKPFLQQLVSGDFNASQLYCPECASNKLMRVMAYIQQDRVTFSKGIKNFRQPGNVNNCIVTQSKYNQVRNKHLLHPELYEEKQIRQIVQQSAKKHVDFTESVQGAAGNTAADDVAYFLKRNKKNVKHGKGVK